MADRIDSKQESYKEVKKKYFWKVILNDNDLSIPLSCSSNGEEAQPAEDWVVKYKFNEWVTARKSWADKGYHLLVFKSRKFARLFMSNNYGNGRWYVLYKCKVQDPVENMPIMLDVGLSHHPVFKDGIWPEGTCMFKKVMLLSGLHWGPPGIKS